MRVVFDTNVIISASLLPSSKPRVSLDLVQDDGVILMSKELILEYRIKIQKPKFDKYVERKKREKFIIQLALFSDWFDIHPIPRICRDPDDDHILALASAGNATHIVTGDDDLLILHPWNGIAILTPQAFLDSVNSPP